MVGRVDVAAGICGMVAHIRAGELDLSVLVKLEITSDCEWIRNLAGELTEVNPLEEVSHRGAGPKTYRMARKHLPHAACVVPAGIIKAVEVAAGLALPEAAQLSIQKE